jgi:hypothetical protein
VPAKEIAEKKLVGFIDLTPKWVDLMPFYLDAIENGNPTQRKIAKEDLTKMAAFVDEVNAERKKDKTT